ncbi:hypothetical protein L1987_25077 [Smallanthus sonchifolius]|uniref:Uncharacterized protein n=1 Tax=Smallanthus sonchifolius TaxID=185202 RepID=A0ACB9ILJ4_9ASTR|nr:hypothetical protein L1987_25077 [Smallanthus sonchifolius]
MWVHTHAHTAPKVCYMSNTSPIFFFQPLIFFPSHFVHATFFISFCTHSFIFGVYTNIPTYGILFPIETAARDGTKQNLRLPVSCSCPRLVATSLAIPFYLQVS